MNDDRSRDLAKAFRFHQEGHLDAAEEVYRKLLSSSPGDAETRHLLGFLSYQRGRWDEAQELISEAVASDPLHPLYHNSLGDVFRARGMAERAKECYKRAIRMKPDFADALHSLGEIYRMEGDLHEAIRWLARALELNPKKPELYFSLGKAFKDKKEFDAACACHEAGLKLNPGFAEGQGSLGEVLAAMGKRDEAMACYQAALRLKPNLPSVKNNIANLLKDQGRLAEAISMYREALDEQPEKAEIHYNLASALVTALEFREAVKEFDIATELRPDYAEAHSDKGLLLLLLGELARGWEEYEWRFKIKDASQPVDNRSFGVPLWDGSELQGKTILVHSEQGAGDAIQFCRYLPMVKAQGGNVIFESPSKLSQLFSGIPGADRVIERSETPALEFDVRIPLLSLPRIFGTTISSVPAAVPYLRARPEMAEKARSMVSGENFKIGICWQGNPKYKGDPQRSTPLHEFLPVLQMPGVRVFSLQKGFGSEQTGLLPPGASLTDLGSMLDEETAPFLETAAVISQLDLVISVDTGILHLAGALGRPVWLVAAFVPEWRWLLDRDDSPWYPTLRIFRQNTLGDWRSAFAKVAEALRALVPEKRGVREAGGPGQ